jgi:hypothetical protein
VAGTITLTVDGGTSAPLSLSIEAGALTLAGQTVGVSQGGEATYTPFIARTLGEGTNGNNLTTFNPEGAGIKYSNDITGPFGESIVAKVTATAGNNNFGGWFDFDDYGGHIANSTLASEGDMWVRIYHYFPTGFCAGFGSTGGDGYGATKWLRFQFGTAAQDYWEGSRMTYQLGNFSSGSCASAANAPRISYVSMEGFPDQNDPPNFYWGDEYDYNGGTVITRNTWHALQLHIHWGSTRASSYVRGWLDDTYLGQPIQNSATLAGGSTYLKHLWIGDYWNGSPASNCSWYLANMIITRETPNTTDSGGRPYIAPDTDAADF